MAAMQLTKSNSVVEVWGAQGIWENVVLQLDGSGWRRAEVLPYSNGGNDKRVSIAGASDGSLWAAWASDQRSFLNGQIGQQNVFAAAVPKVSASGEIAMKPFVETPDLSKVT